MERLLDLASPPDGAAQVGPATGMARVDLDGLPQGRNRSVNLRYRAWYELPYRARRVGSGKPKANAVRETTGVVVARNVLAWRLAILPLHELRVHLPTVICRVYRPR